MLSKKRHQRILKVLEKALARLVKNNKSNCRPAQSIRDHILKIQAEIAGKHNSGKMRPATEPAMDNG